MTIKFDDIKHESFLEIQQTESGVSFFITAYGEEQVGQFIEIHPSEIQNIINFLQSKQMYQ